MSNNGSSRRPCGRTPNGAQRQELELLRCKLQDELEMTVMMKRIEAGYGGGARMASVNIALTAKA
jgi:hypothetical protein